MIEIDAASNRSIDEIRSLKEKINYQPVEGLKKVYIIDEAHMLTKEAFNALLKTLEEPPSHVMFILATTELDKILPTIISRCQRYDFKALDIEDMKSGLKHILKEENLSVERQRPSVLSIRNFLRCLDARLDGEGGRFLQIKGKIFSFFYKPMNGNEINLKIAEDTLGVTPSSRIKIFLDKLLNESEYNIINELEALANESFDIELFFKDLAKYCKNVIVKNELDIDKGLKIISTIYDVINKFKFEDDKKLVGYVIVADILANSTQTIVRTVTKVQKVVEDTDNTPNTVVEAVKEKPKVQITIADVKSNWNSILDEAKKKRISYKVFLMGANPVRVEDNIIFITYDKKYLFPKEQMESEEYNKEFTEIIRKFFNENSLELKYEVIGQKKEEESGEEEFFKKIENYFKGNS